MKPATEGWVRLGDCCRVISGTTPDISEPLYWGGDVTWITTGLVFTTYAPRGAMRKQGTPLEPRNVVRVLHAIVDGAKPKLPRVRFHDLRHSAASLLIASGVELAEVSKLLGHSEIRITSDLYSHLMKQTATKAARHMDALFGNA